MWQAWVIGILGIWVIIEPYLNMSSAANKWVLVITGLIIAILGFWGAGSNKEM
ncbi:MAG: hypothetical protein WC080_00015 [Patescibacteria group bacterium]